MSPPTVDISYKKILDMAFKSTTQSDYPAPPKLPYRAKTEITSSIPSRHLAAIDTTSHRDKFDAPAFAHSTMELTDKKPASEQQHPIWSRHPPEGCTKPSTCEKPARSVSPGTCDCPASCCLRSACQRKTPVCICGTPCTEPNGRSLICNACLCYNLPKKEISKYFCPRSETDAPICPECKVALPRDPIGKKRFIPKFSNMPVAKTFSPIFRKITRSQ